MTTTEQAIHDSLIELRRSLQLDQQMIRNYRTALVKAQELDQVSMLKEIEERLESLLQSLEKATEKGQS